MASELKELDHLASWRSSRAAIFDVLSGMLRARGYTEVTAHVATTEDGDAGVDAAVIRGDCVLSGYDPLSPGRVTHVFILPSMKFGISQARRLNQMRADSADSDVSFVVIASAKPTPPAQKYTTAAPWLCEFQPGHVRQCIVEHCLVCAHELVPPTERAAVMAAMGVSPGQDIPEMLCRDPVARYYGFQPGDLVVSRPKTGCLQMESMLVKVIPGAYTSRVA